MKTFNIPHNSDWLVSEFDGSFLSLSICPEFENWLEENCIGDWTLISDGIYKFSIVFGNDNDYTSLLLSCDWTMINNETNNIT